jgi:hypothetical protein
MIEPSMATQLLREAVQRGVADAVGFTSVPRTADGLKQLAKKCASSAGTLRGAVDQLPEEHRTEAANIVAACATFGLVLEDLAKGDLRTAKNTYHL